MFKWNMSSVVSSDLLQPPAGLYERPPLPEEHGDDGGGGKGVAHAHLPSHLLHPQLAPVTQDGGPDGERYRDDAFLNLPPPLKLKIPWRTPFIGYLLAAMSMELVSHIS